MGFVPLAVMTKVPTGLDAVAIVVAASPSMLPEVSPLTRPVTVVVSWGRSAPYTLDFASAVMVRAALVTVKTPSTRVTL